jgi:hypothetical protein
MEEEETDEDEDLNEEDELRNKLKAVGLENLYGDDKKTKGSTVAAQEHEKDD